MTVASDELVVLRGVALTLPLTGSQLRLAQLACGPSTETPWMTSQPCPCQHRTCFPADPSCGTASRSHCASSRNASVDWPARCTCTSVRQVSATASYACMLQLCFWLYENLIQHCLQWAKPGMRKSLLSRVKERAYKMQCTIHKHVCLATAVTNANVCLQPHLIGLDDPDILRYV